MRKDKSCELADVSRAQELVMMERIFDKAIAFYKDPKNLQAFQAWQKNKEETNHGTNNANLRFEPRKRREP